MCMCVSTKFTSLFTAQSMCSYSAGRLYLCLAGTIEKFRYLRCAIIATFDARYFVSMNSSKATVAVQWNRWRHAFSGQQKWVKCENTNSGQVTTARELIGRQFNCAKLKNSVVPVSLCKLIKPGFVCADIKITFNVLIIVDYAGPPYYLNRF